MTIKVKVENTGHLPVDVYRQGLRESPPIVEARLAPGQSWEGHVWHGAAIAVVEPTDVFEGHVDPSITRLKPRTPS